MPGTSLVHNMNAQVKIILTCVFSVAAFFLETWLGLGLLAAVTCIVYAVARVDLGRAILGIKPVTVILLLTVVCHAFSLNAADAANNSALLGGFATGVYVTLVGSFGITLAGVLSGVFFAVRICLLVIICCLLTFTTSMREMVDALNGLLKPLSVLHVPVEDISTIISIALRFIPTTIEEAVRISNAQKARCASFDTGNVFKRLGAWFYVLIPLFVRLFMRADELACAMDARCYGTCPRTHLHNLKMGGADVCVLLVCSALIIVLCVFL